MRGQHGRQREGAEQNGREAAVDVLLGPVDQPVVTAKKQDADDEDQRPLGAPARPARADGGDDDGKNGGRDQESERRDREGTESSVADFDRQPRRAPDKTEKAEERDPDRVQHQGIMSHVR